MFLLLFSLIRGCREIIRSLLSTFALEGRSFCWENKEKTKKAGTLKRPPSLRRLFKSGFPLFFKKCRVHSSFPNKPLYFRNVRCIPREGWIQTCAKLTFFVHHSPPSSREHDRLKGPCSYSPSPLFCPPATPPTRSLPKLFMPTITHA